MLSYDILVLLRQHGWDNQITPEVRRLLLEGLGEGESNIYFRSFIRLFLKGRWPEAEAKLIEVAEESGDPSGVVSYVLNSGQEVRKDPGVRAWAEHVLLEREPPTWNWLEVAMAWAMNHSWSDVGAQYRERYAEMAHELKGKATSHTPVQGQ